MTLNEFFDEWRQKGDENRCFYCGVALLAGPHIPDLHPHLKTKDHFVPKSRRKTLFGVLPVSLQNKIMTVKSCATCNSIKGSRTPEALRTHVRKINQGSETFFCEAFLGATLRSMPEYLAYCEVVLQESRKAKQVLTQRSLKAIAERRAAGLIPPAGHKMMRRRAMQENDWWNAMNSLGKLIFAFKRNGIHPEVTDQLVDTIALIKSTLPEEFARRKLEVKDAKESTKETANHS